MKGFVPPDPESGVSQARFATIHTPRKNRKRFAAGCVTVYEDRQTALEASDPDHKYYAAQVLGPSKSSEGQFIYYLLEWVN